MIQGMLGAFRELDAAVDAIEALKKDRTGEITVYTPTPRHELEHAVHPPVSPVRKFTLAGGLFGAIAGYWIAIWCSEYWPLVVGGKAISTWIPYTIFSFELMVLIGGLSTVAGAPYVINPAGFAASSTDFCVTAAAGRWIAVQHGPGGGTSVGTLFTPGTCTVS